MRSHAKMPPPLPIEEIVPELRAHLAASMSVVLQAPPGAGKTTGIPIALLASPWLESNRIVMLEPRRLATRAAARRMAAMLGESVGSTVGFRVRGETRVSASTRIEVITEGVLTRMLLDDPALDGIGLVIFDEFHERGLHADLGLALTLQTQEVLRPDLRVLVMSATLDGAAVSRLLSDAPVITSKGRQFAVEVRYSPPRPGARIEDAVAMAIRHSLSRDEGSILAFLPGAGEIRRCASALSAAELAGRPLILPLYGDLPAAAQDAAIAAPRTGERKVVLATSIAETSLTIEGVRVVIDCGLARVSRFSPRTGMSRLETVRVSQSAAEQRRGRAGRTSEGTCYRLWPEEEHAHLLARARPEILDADLAPLALDLAVTAIVDASDLEWLDAPPPAALSHARALLLQLGAIDAALRITPHGRAMSALGVHPRIAHMLIVARTRGEGVTASLVAALLEERDIVRRADGVNDDLRNRIAIMREGAREHAADVDRDAVRRVRERWRALQSSLKIGAHGDVDEHLAGSLLALAYPERVAQRRAGDDAGYLLRNGTGAVLAAGSALGASAYIAVADLDGRLPHSRVYLAAPLAEAEVRASFASEIVEEEVVEWNGTRGGVDAAHRELLGAIVLHQSTVREPDRGLVRDALLHALSRGDGLALPWTDAARQLCARVVFLRRRDEAWPDFDENRLLASAREWLGPHLDGVRRRSEFERLPLSDILLRLLTWEQRRRLDELAPTHIVVPTGSRIAIDYTDPAFPTLSVRLQEMFGLSDTPRVAGGEVPLTLHLLSPAQRPVQVTRDLAGFWRTSYFDVRKDLRGRYPKHEWPDDPLSATPTRRAKPRK